MAYLCADEYTLFGLEETIPASLVMAASELIDAHCRRKGFGIAQYMERFRVGRSRTVRLSYLPLVAASGAASPIVLARGRYTGNAGDWGAVEALAAEVAEVFTAPNTWFSVPVNSLDLDLQSGEVIVCCGLLAPALRDLELTYTAGYAEVPWAVKQACAKLVKNALATPALNVSKQKIDTMYLQYFADTLVDMDVRQLLAPTSRRGFRRERLRYERRGGGLGAGGAGDAAHAGCGQGLAAGAAAGCGKRADRLGADGSAGERGGDGAGVCCRRRRTGKLCLRG